MELKRKNSTSISVQLNDYKSIDNENDESKTDLSKYPFAWLDILVLYCPMWSTKYISRRSNDSSQLQQHDRNQWLSGIMISLTIICVLYHIVVSCVLHVHYMHDYEAYDTIYVTLYLTIQIGTTIARLILVWYFKKDFNYPWIICVDGFEVDVQSKYWRTISKYNKFIGVLTISSLFSDGLVLYHFVFQNHLLQSPTPFHKAFTVSVILGRMFKWWPLIISLSVACVVFLKYYLYLLELSNIVEKGNFKFDELLNKYEILMNAFKCDYNKCLKVSVELYLAGFIIDIWIGIYEVFNLSVYFVLVGIFTNTFGYLLFVISASLITEGFEQFEKKLWNHCKDNIKQQDQNTFKYQTFLLNYIDKHPLVMKFGSFKITKVNGIKFVLIFVVSKFFAYSLRYIVD